MTSWINIKILLGIKNKRFLANRIKMSILKPIEWTTGMLNEIKDYFLCL